MNDKHNTPVLARRELIRRGYTVAHTPPGQPDLWVRPGEPEQLAIARINEGDTPYWHIVPYPTSTTNTHEERTYV